MQVGRATVNCPRRRVARCRGVAKLRGLLPLPGDAKSKYGKHERQPCGRRIDSQ